jgi:predicted aspartyl protease
MSTEDPAQGGGGIVFPLQPKGRRRREPPYFLIAAAIVVAAAVGGWFYLNPPTVNGERPWTLPTGIPSMSEAAMCQRDGDLPCAEADLIAYTRKYPTEAKAFAMLAILLTQDGRHKEALYYYQKAEGMGVGTYDFDAGYARSLDATGHIDAAMTRNQAALALYPTLVDVRESLANELVRKGRGKEALDLLESFDRQLEDEGHPAYFTAQIRQIKINLGGQYAKEAAAADAEANAPTPVIAGQTTVKGRRESGTLVVPISIDDGPPMDFVVDSGASTIAMPSASAAPLFRAGRLGQGNFRGRGMAVLANGSVVQVDVFNLKSVTVGGRTLSNVPISVYRGYGPNLLGQSFLRRFKSWSIDNGKRELVLTN